MPALYMSLFKCLMSARPTADKKKTYFGPVMVVDPHFKVLHYVDVDCEQKQAALLNTAD